MNAATSLAQDEVSNPMRPALNRPMVAPALQDFFQIPLVWRKAGNAMNLLEGGWLGVEMIDRAFQEQDLADGGPIEIAIQVGTSVFRFRCWGRSHGMSARAAKGERRVGASGSPLSQATKRLKFIATAVAMAWT